MRFPQLVIVCVLACLAFSSIGCDQTKSHEGQPQGNGAAPAATDTQTESGQTEKTDSPADQQPDEPDKPAEAEAEGNDGDASAANTGDPTNPDLARLTPLHRQQIEKIRDLVAKSPASAELNGELAMHYMAIDESQAALHYLNRAIELVPNTMNYVYLRGLLYRGIDRPELAIQDFRRAIELDDSYAAAHVNLARTILEDNPTEAAALFAKASELQPDNATAWFGRGRAAEMQSDNAAAREFYQKALTLADDYADPHAGLARLYQQAGESELAQRHQRAAARGRGPSIHGDPLAIEVFRRSVNEDRLALAAVEMAKRGQFARAVEMLESAVSQGADTGSVHNSLGEIYLQMGLGDAALAQFMRGIDVEPGSLALQSNLGRAFQAIGNSVEAEKRFRAILKDHPEHATTHNRLGKMLGAGGAQAEVEKHLREAVRLEPLNGRFRVDLVQFLIGVGNLANAETELSSIDTDSPLAAQKLFLEGLLLQRRGKSGFRAKWEVAIDANPTLAAPYLALTQDAVRNGKFDSALDVLLLGVSNVPNNIDMKNNAAWIMATSQNRALRDGKRAVELATEACEYSGFNNHSLLGTLAAAYAETGDFAKAMYYSERAAELAGIQDNDEAAGIHRERRARYESKRPLRQ